MSRPPGGLTGFFRALSGLLHERPDRLPVVKILDSSRRDSLARRFALLAISCLSLIAAAAAVTMPDELRSVLATAGLAAYAYCSGKAMQLWQGRGQPSLHRSAWRRRFLHERTAAAGRTPVDRAIRDENRRFVRP
jgi:hypothetical protein